MTLLSYHIEVTEGVMGHQLQVRIEDPLGQVLNAAAMLQRAQKSAEREALQMLFSEEKKFKSPQLHIYRVRQAMGFKVLKALGVTGRVFYEGVKVVIDPFTHVEILIEAAKNADAISLSGKWRSGLSSGPISECALVFAGNPGWVLKNRIIYPSVFAHEQKWLDWIYPQGALLQGADALAFLKKASDVIWIENRPCDPIPFLVLCERHGAFANLWFDYGTFGRVQAHAEEKAASWRDVSSEKALEADLLETDFIKKHVDSTHYYCPLDKVGKSLTFILEIGWKIVDHRGRQVLRQKAKEIDTEVTASHVVIRGKIEYGEHVADLKDCVGAFNRKERFIDLSPSTVGLLDEQETKNWEGLVEHQVVGSALLVKKQNIGLLASLFAQEVPPSLDYSTLFTSLPQGWHRASEKVSSLFQGELFAYQSEGVKWLSFLYESQCGGLLADEMGLGKTVQVVAFLSQLDLSRPCLIVVPTSLVFHWQRELERFLPSCPVYIHTGKERLKSLERIVQPQVIITSYALLRLDANLLKEIDYQLIVLDEAQMIKNADSQIAQTVFDMRATMRLCCTGTPIENRMEDLWSLFHFLLPGLLGERQNFSAAMSAANSDQRYVEQVKRKIRPFLLRRKKSEVAIQLPDKMEQTIWVEMTEDQRLMYDQFLASAKKGLIEKISTGGMAAQRMQILETLLRLRQICVHPQLVTFLQVGPQEDLGDLSGKCARLFLDLQEVIEENKKVIIYSQFTTMLRILRQAVEKKGWEHVYLDGETKEREREERVQSFQKDPVISLFLISLKAGGVGLNLTSADYVFLLDPWWNEAVEKQAIDRAHRLGRKDVVIARRYVTALSIEEKMMHLKKQKTDLSRGLFEEDAHLSALSLEELMQLIIG